MLLTSKSDMKESPATLVRHASRQPSHSTTSSPPPTHHCTQSSRYFATSYYTDDTVILGYRSDTESTVSERLYKRTFSPADHEASAYEQYLDDLELSEKFAGLTTSVSYSLAENPPTTADAEESTEPTLQNTLQETLTACRETVARRTRCLNLPGKAQLLGKVVRKTGLGSRPMGFV